MRPNRVAGGSPPPVPTPPGTRARAVRLASAARFRGGEAGGGCYAFERDEHRSPARRVARHDRSEGT